MTNIYQDDTKETPDDTNLLYNGRGHNTSSLSIKDTAGRSNTQNKHGNHISLENTGDMGEKVTPQGLGGWLIVLGFGLCISPLIIGLGLYEYKAIFQDFHLLADTLLLQILIIVEFAVNLAFIVFASVLILYFFTKHRLFPLLFKIYLITSLIFMISDEIIGRFVLNFGIENDIESLRGIMISLISTIVWISYIQRSIRVKYTFIHHQIQQVPIFVTLWIAGVAFTLMRILKNIF